MPVLKSPFPEQALQKRVVEFPPANQGFGPANSISITMHIASVADTITPWGRGVMRRDRELRDFWPTENMLAGAIGGVCMRNSAFEWKVEGPKLTREATTFMLHSALAGTTQGWMPFISALSLDLMTQDNGAFFELIRQENSPTSAVVGIGHLDSSRCLRTSDPYYPVIYKDIRGNLHKLAWYQVIAMSDLPSPIEEMYGVGYCAVSRTLRAAQILKDLAIYKHEKVSGRFTRAIHIVGGLSKRDLEDLQTSDEEKADNKGLTRFMMPMILASLDPEKPVSHVEIPLASLPDGFDLDQELKWYVATLALGIGSDYQDLAPLPGGGIGSSNQSEILHKKSRGKGPAFFMNYLRDTFKYRGVLPRTVDFLFYEQDLGADKEKAELSEIRARTRFLQMRSGEINQAIARTIAIRNDDFEEEDLNLLKEADIVVPQNYIGDGQGNSSSLGAGENNDMSAGGPTKKIQSEGALSKKEEIRLKEEMRVVVPTIHLTLPDVVVNVPEQKDIVVPAPIVTVNVPEQPAPIVIVKDQKDVVIPAPVVNVNVPVPAVTVNVPKKRKEKQKIHRDGRGNIESTETTIEYDKE